MARGLSPTSQKIVLLLAGGFILGLTRSPKQYFRVVRAIGAGWKEINKQALHRAIKKLYESKLVSYRELEDGTVEIGLTEGGQIKALKYDLDKMQIPKPPKWDKKWRVVLFDVPEHQKKLREAMRDHLKDLGFLTFQKSVFVYPYPCTNEIEFLIEFYDARSHVRQMLVEKIDNELHLKKKFKLI